MGMYANNLERLIRALPNGPELDRCMKLRDYINRYDEIDLSSEEREEIQEMADKLL